MLGFFRNLHNRRPIMWSVIAFIIVVVTMAGLTVWWNVLLVQNHRILKTMTAAATAAANDPGRANVPLALLMVIGLLCSLVIVLGLVYMFLRLIRTVQLNLAQSQFIAAVTHELKSPVAGLTLMLDTIRDPTTPDEKRREFEQCMSSDLKRLKMLVEQVLDTARLENFTMAQTIEEVDVKDFVDSCVDAIDTRLKTTSSSIQVSPIDPTLKLKANRRLLASAVLNVLDNAIKYSRGPAKIVVDVVASARSVAIEISDHGIGIPRKELKRVFKRFYRAPGAATEAKPGTGLGLYFARLAVRAQGGKIAVRSLGPGHGSTFRVELPKP